MKAGFVARGFTGMGNLLVTLIQKGIAHPGFALIDILQPCVTFNKVNTYRWYKERCRDVPADHDPLNWDAAMKVAAQWDEHIPVGLIYRNDRPPFESHFPACAKGTLFEHKTNRETLAAILKTYA